MKLYMMVTQDEYELPLIVSDNVAVVADYAGTSTNNVYSSASKRKHLGRKSRFVVVEVEDEQGTGS